MIILLLKLLPTSNKNKSKSCNTDKDIKQTKNIDTTMKGIRTQNRKKEEGKNYKVGRQAIRHS